MMGSTLILVGVILLISKISLWNTHTRKEYQLLQNDKAKILRLNASELIASGPIASWTIDHWENSENLASDIDDVIVIQNELGKTEKLKSKRIPQVICVGSKECGTGALLKFMSHHPDVHRPNMDEVHFFDTSEYNKAGFSAFILLN